MVSAFLVLTAAALVQAQSAAQTDFLRQFAGIVNSQPACVGACISSFDSTSDALTLTRHMCANAGQTAAFVSTCVQRTGGCSGSDLAMGNAFAAAISKGICDVWASISIPTAPTTTAAAPPSTVTTAGVALPATTTTAAIVQTITTAAVPTTTSNVAPTSAVVAATSVGALRTSATSQINPLTTPAVSLDGCTTASGAYISIIAPAANDIYTVGQKMTILWAIVGNPDPDFNAATIGFEIANAADPNNVQSVPGGALSFSPSNPLVSDISATATVPSIQSGNLYTLKSIYKDGSAIKSCFSPTFKIVNNGSPVVTANSGSSGAVAAGQTTKTGAGSVASIGLGGLLAAAFFC